MRIDDVTGAISAGIQQLQQQANSLSAELSREQSAASALQQETGRYYKRITQLHVPELNATEVSEAPSALRAQFGQLHTQQEKRQQQLSDRMEQSTRHESELREQLGPLVRRLASERETRDHDMSSVETDLAANPEYVAVHQKLERLTDKLADVAYEQMELKLLQNKYRAPHENKLATYLRERQFGNKPARGIFARLDRWVASLENFAQNNAKYVKLTQTDQAQLDQIHAQTTAEQSAAKEQEQKLRAAAERPYELAPRRQTIAALEKQEGELQASLTAEKGAYLAAEQELAVIHSDRSTFLAQAQDSYSSWLSSLSEQALRALAAQTADTEDDGLVENILNNNRQAASHLGRAQGLQQQLQSVRSRIQGLEGARSTIQSTYTNSRDRVNDSCNVSDLVTGYILGRRSANDITGAVSSSHYRVAPPPPPPSIPSYRPSSTHRPSGGGFGGGSISRGGSFGGGGRVTRGGRF